MMLGHEAAGMEQQNSVGVNEPDLLTLAYKGHRLPLHKLNANLVWEQTHDRSVLYPWNRFKLLAPVAEVDKENIAADVLAEDGQQLGAAHLSHAGGLDIAGACNAEASVALKKCFQEKDAGGRSAQDDEHAEAEKYATDGAGRTPPALAAPFVVSAAGVGWAVAVRVAKSSGMPVGRARVRTHLPQRAGSESPRALHHPRPGDGFCYCVDSSRLSKVVRVARFTIDCGLMALAHRNSGGIRNVTGQEEGLKIRAAREAMMIHRCPGRFCLLTYR